MLTRRDPNGRISRRWRRTSIIWCARSAWPRGNSAWTSSCSSWSSCGRRRSTAASHILAAESLGISVDKLNLVVVWREAPIFSSRERAALAWTEALTLVAQGVSDEVYAEVSAEFPEQELAYLSSAIAAINVWNRFGAPYRWAPPARQKP